MAEADDAFPLTDVERDAILASVATGDEGITAARRFFDGRGEDADRIDRLLPGVYRQQTRLGNDDPRLADLAAAYRHTAAENTLILRTALAPLAELAERSIRPVVLKGGAIVSDRYLGDVAGRLLSDLDVLFEPNVYGEVVEWFLAEGWQVADPSWHPASKHAVNVARGRWGSLDLHAHLLSGDRNLELDQHLREGAVTTELLGQKILVPEPTQLLIHAIGHSSRSDLRFLVDAHRLIVDHEIDWSTLVEHLTARRHVAVATRALGALSTIDAELVPREVMRSLETADRHRVDTVRDPIAPSMTVRASVSRFRASLGRKARHLGPIGTARVALVVARQRIDKSLGRRRAGTDGR